MTQIYLSKKSLLRHVTTVFSGDVLLNENVMTLDNAEVDVSFHAWVIVTCTWSLDIAQH